MRLWLSTKGCRRGYQRQALFQFVLLLWMGTGGVLHHADAVRPSAPASGTTVLYSWSHAVPVAAPDDCAACQWAQAVLTGSSPPYRVVLPFRSALSCDETVAPLLFSRSPSRRCPRAPPTLP